MIWAFIPGALIALGFMIATWEDDNHWKVLFVAVLMVLGLWSTQGMSYSKGYDNGFDDGTCFVYTVLDAKPNIDVTVPERCTDE